MKTLPSPIAYHVYQGQELPEPCPYDYVLDRWGVVKRAMTPFYEARVRVAEGRVAGLSTVYGVGDFAGDAAIRLTVPKIPARWLEQVLRHAQRAGDERDIILRPVEQMYHFHWLDGEWQVSVPKQEASGSRVRYRGGNERSIVLDLHSHHRLGAFFSPTDDRDEQGCRFYAVIGRIYRRPEIRLRLGLFGDFIELSALDLFEGLGPFMEAL